MIWLVVILVVVVVGLGVLALGYGNVSPNPTDYQVRVELHGIRRRQEVAEVKREIRRDAAQARRELRAGLEDLNKWERQQ